MPTKDQRPTASAAIQEEEGLLNPKPTLKKDGTPRKYTKKGFTSSYKRKGVSYGSSKPTNTMKVNATIHDKRMLDEAHRSPLHKTNSKTTKYTLVPADYKPTTLTTPPHLARQPEPEPTETKEQIYLESLKSDRPDPIDPQCYKVEFPESMKQNKMQKNRQRTNTTSTTPQQLEKQLATQKPSAPRKLSQS